MASNGEIKGNEATHHHHQSVKHRAGNAAQQPSRMASNRVSSSRQSGGSASNSYYNDDSNAAKSRIGASAAIKALCGKAAAASKKKSPRKSASSSSKDDDGCIVKTPAKGGIHGQVRCETAEELNAPQRVASGDGTCYDVPYRRIREKCTNPKEKWQNGIYCRDECGSGIIAKKLEFKQSRQVWCRVPLSMYQATIGELGRQVLCGEKIIPRDVRPGPPCNVCEYILPQCRGYYRKYDCVRPCEEDYVSYKRGRKLYRDRVERYWEPCMTKEQRIPIDINTFAHQNVFLGNKLKRRFNETMPCW